MALESRIPLQPALSAALDFLLQAQDARGAWKDFLLPAGHSDIWVTAFVGGVLAGLPEPRAQRAAETAWHFLSKAATSEGGWSYNGQVPGDGDSTLWGLRLAESLGVEGSPRARAAADFLQRHLREDGGLTTYASPDPVRDYIGLPPAFPFSGWTRSHVCVSAAGANLSSWPGLQGGRLREYLLRHQAQQGHWPAYWWFDDEYSTAEAVAALAAPRRQAPPREPELAQRLQQAAHWAQGRVGHHTHTGQARPPAFALSHALRVLAHTAPSTQPPSQVLSQGLHRLLEWQKPDGSWPASARLRVPRPDSVNPSPQAEWRLWAGMPPNASSLVDVLRYTFTNYSLDHGAVYTTASVLRALSELISLQA